MAGLKQIKSRLKSVNNTKKITYAMKLVSAAKLRKAQTSVVKSREYTTALSQLIADLAQEMSGTELSHPLMEKRVEVKKVRLLIVGGSRGLCGGYNSNVNRRAVAALNELAVSHPGAAIEAVILGKKPAEFFRRTKRSYTESYEELPDDPNRWPLENVCRQCERDFLAGEVDAVYMIYTRFKSAMSQTVMLDKVLPMDQSGAEGHSGAGEAAPGGQILFEPSPEAVFAAVMPRVLRARVLQAALDSKASEHGSRMTAMDAATKNAGEIAHKLKLLRNKIRQSGITADLLDIIGGAEALNK